MSFATAAIRSASGMATWLSTGPASSRTASAGAASLRATLPSPLDPFAAAAGFFSTRNLTDAPVTRSKERAGVHLWSRQREIANSVVENRRTAVQSAHGLGKSFLAATLAAWWIDVHDPDETMVVTTAPSLDQVHAILWAEIRGLHDRANLPGVVQRTDRWLVDGR